MTRALFTPHPLRGFLMWLAFSGAFRARWSEQIHDEWKRYLLENRSDLTPQQIDRTIVMMNDAIPGEARNSSATAVTERDLVIRPSHSGQERAKAKRPEKDPFYSVHAWFSGYVASVRSTQSRGYSPFRVDLAPSAAASLSHTYVPLFVRPYQR
jgi:hypothetical protein